MAGSATRRSVAAVREELTRQASGCNLQVARELFALYMVLHQIPQLRIDLSNEAVSPAKREQLLASIFNSELSPATLNIFRALMAQSWSCPGDLPMVVEEIGVRALSLGVEDPQQVGKELFAVSRVLDSNPELELTLSSRLVTADEKSRLLTTLFASRISPTALELIVHIVRAPVQRRFPAALEYVSWILSDQAGADLATVTVARPLTSQHRENLRSQLSARTGRKVHLREKVQPDVTGGARVRLGCRVIDGTVRARLNELQRQLAV